MSDEYDHKEKVEQTERGYRLTITSKRGTGTRDQDEVSLSGRAETLEQLEDERPRMNAMVAQTMNIRRQHQPDGDPDE